MSYIGILLQGNASMKAYSDGIEVIGENTSNANTPGYQGQQVTFSEVYGDSGAVGVKVNSQHMSFEKGEPEYTGNPLDLYVDGDGYFLLQDGDNYFLTRAGMFQLDESGNLVDQVTGSSVVLLSDNGNPIEISVDDYQTFEHVPSNTLTLSGTLNSSLALNETYPGEGDLPIVIDVIDSQGGVQSLNAEFTKSSNGKWLLTLKDNLGFVVSSNNEIYFDNEGNIREDFSSLDVSYNPTVKIEDVNEYITEDIVYNLADSSVEINLEEGAEIPLYVNNELNLASNATLTLVDGKLVDSSTSGELVLQDSQGEYVTDLTEYQSREALPTSTIKLGGNLDETTLNGELITDIDGSPITTEVIQADGTILNLNFNFEKIDTREWEVTLLDDSGEEVTGNRTVTFLSDGSLSPFSRRFTFDIDQADGSIQTIEVVLDDSNGIALQQSESAADVAIEDVDGELSSQLETITFKQDGDVVLTYDDGKSVTPLTMMLVESALQASENITINLNGVDGPLTVSNDNPTQITVKDENGLAEGRLVNTYVNNDGNFSVVYSNGEELELAAVAVAKVTDSNAVFHEGGSRLKVLNLDGIEISATDEDSTLGVVSGVIELSNVDISDEFTKMVLLQRGYQASSHVVSVANSMLDDLYKAIE